MIGLMTEFFVAAVFFEGDEEADEGVPKIEDIVE